MWDRLIYVVSGTHAEYVAWFTGRGIPYEQTRRISSSSNIGCQVNCDVYFVGTWRSLLGIERINAKLNDRAAVLGDVRIHGRTI